MKTHCQCGSDGAHSAHDWHKGAVGNKEFPLQEFSCPGRTAREAREKWERQNKPWYVELPKDWYCEHGYLLRDAPHPAAGLEHCLEGCDSCECGHSHEDLCGGELCAHQNA